MRVEPRATASTKYYPCAFPAMPHAQRNQCPYFRPTRLWRVERQIQPNHVIMLEILWKTLYMNNFVLFHRGRATLRHEWAVASWAGSTGVIPRPHRKLAWNNTCVVFRRVSEVTGGPNPLKGRQRTCDSSGVAGVHGRRWSLSIRRSVCSFALQYHKKNVYYRCTYPDEIVVYIIHKKFIIYCYWCINVIINNK